MELIEQIQAYEPFNEQERADKALLLGALLSGEDFFTRDNQTAHLTASAWVVTPDRRESS